MLCPIAPRCSSGKHGRRFIGARGLIDAGLLRCVAMAERATFRVKTGLAEMLKGGVIMDVVERRAGAKIAEDAGACAVMALERVPADIRRDGGVARMSNPAMIKEIQEDGDDPGHGQGPHRPLRRGPGAAVPRGRLHRRVRGADPGRRGQPHRQARLRRPVRLRRHQPRRGAAAHRRGRRDDPLQGRGRHRQHRRGGPPHARDHRRDQAASRRCGPSSSPAPPRSFRRRSTSSRRSPSAAGCRCRSSAPAASRPRPTPR